MIGPHLIPKIERAINDLASEYMRVPGLILTEDDLKCQLFHRLSHIPELEGSSETVDSGTLASLVHAEVPWFDENSQLKLRPDITITDPRDLSIHHAMQRRLSLPTKRFHFIGDSILFELKFYRGKGGITSRSITKVRNDVEKIRRLRRRSQVLRPGIFIYGFVVVFTKYLPQSDLLNQLVNETNKDHGIKLLVRSSGLD